MTASVIVRSKDEADRLRLTLASLSRQTTPVQVVVVNDGSTDHTRDVLEEAADILDLAVVHNAQPTGRSAASNAGARHARGDLLLFLDGDTLAGPQFVARHLQAHALHPAKIGRGENHHLRCTRFLRDPETGEPWAEHADRIERLPATEREAMRVTRRQVLENFEAIVRRAEAAIYPGAAARRLQELEMQALRDMPKSRVLWAAASGSNLSVARDAFLEVGGFNTEIDINEHRELAYRLSRKGLGMMPVSGAHSYHLCHRSGWRDPLKDHRWEAIFHAAHPESAAPLLSVFWASVSMMPALPVELRINSLAELEAASAERSGYDLGGARRALGLPDLAGAGAVSH
jgi:glycosyltransferase involved in cell wall biosynthesis